MTITQIFNISNKEFKIRKLSSSRFFGVLKYSPSAPEVSELFTRRFCHWCVKLLTFSLLSPFFPSFAVRCLDLNAHTSRVSKI